jgi:hypothetical protein
VRSAETEVQAYKQPGARDPAEMPENRITVADWQGTGSVDMLDYGLVRRNLEDPMSQAHFCGGRGTRTPKSFRTTVFKLCTSHPESSGVSVTSPIWPGQRASLLPS